MGNLKSSPTRRRPSTELQWFTVQRANKALPLVSRIVQDLVAEHERLDDLRRQNQALVALGRQADGDRCEELARRSARRLDELTAELAELGVQPKDLKLGLADFPGRRDGQPVLLCWKLGETAVRWWHATDAGYADRRPIDEACE